MPYIKQLQREMIDPELNKSIEIILDPTKFGTRDKAGAINYITSRMCKAVFDDDTRYDTANSLVGALECCKLELYRRYIVPYEDKKIEENGDI